MTIDVPLVLCPFCGAEPYEEESQRRYNFERAIECGCGVSMVSRPGETREQLRARWNDRAVLVSDEEVERSLIALEGATIDSRHHWTRADFELMRKAIAAARKTP